MWWVPLVAAAISAKAQADATAAKKQENAIASQNAMANNADDELKRKIAEQLAQQSASQPWQGGQWNG